MRYGKEGCGEIIRNIGMIVLLAMACTTVPAVGISGYSMAVSSVDTMGVGIFESGSRACSFLITNSTNYDSAIVGNDKAVSSSETTGITASSAPRP